MRYNQTPTLSTEILTNSEFCVGIEVTGGPAGPEGPDKMTVAPYNKTNVVNDMSHELRRQIRQCLKHQITEIRQGQATFIFGK